MSFLRVIQDGPHDGAFNMAADEFLFREQIRRDDRHPTLRFYRFSKPVITVGYGLWATVSPSFDPSSNGREERAREHTVDEPVPRIRRITGGGMVLHGSDVTYSIVVPLAEYPFLRKARPSYRIIHEELKRALSYFGINAHLSRRHCEAALQTMPKQSGTVIPAEAGIQECGSPIKALGDDTSCQIASLPFRHPDWRIRRSAGRTVARNDGQVQKSSFCFDSPVLFDLMLGESKIAGAGQKRSMGFLLHQGSIAWSVLGEHDHNLPLPHLIQRFSLCLAEMFRLPIKEMSLDAEEIGEIQELCLT